MMQHFPQYLVLKRRKSGKPIKIQRTAAHKLRLANMSGQQLHQLFCHNIAFTCKCFKFFVNVSDILHFTCNNAILRNLLHDLIDRILLDIILKDLRHHGFHLIHKSKLVVIASIYL